MKPKLKSNKIVVTILISICFIFILSPKTYSNSCIKGISVWAFNVLPTLLPFFILTRFIVNLLSPKPSKLDKFFKKVYHTNSSACVYFLSILSGYPMGAKLICNLYEMGRISKNDAKKMLSFCSVSGPMFIVGTVGVSFLFSFKAGVVILISNIIASLLNGLIYRGRQTDNLKFEFVEQKNDKNLIYNCVYDALISILMVGAFIVLSFLIIDVLNNLHILSALTKFVCFCFNCPSKQAVVQSVLKGFVEITRGCLDLGKTGISLAAKTIVACGLVAFGGVSVIFQSLGFLNKLKIGIKTILVQKISQAILAVLVCVPLALIFC